jgi:hypothetical protein
MAVSDFPSAIDGSTVNAPEMTDEAFQLGLLRYSYTSKGILLVGGEAIPEVDIKHTSRSPT